MQVAVGTYRPCLTFLLRPICSPVPSSMDIVLPLRAHIFHLPTPSPRHLCPVPLYPVGTSGRKQWAPTVDGRAGAHGLFSGYSTKDML